MLAAHGHPGNRGEEAACIAGRLLKEVLVRLSRRCQLAAWLRVQRLGKESASRVLVLVDRALRHRVEAAGLRGLEQVYLVVELYLRRDTGSLLTIGGARRLRISGRLPKETWFDCLVVNREPHLIRNCKIAGHFI